MIFSATVGRSVLVGILMLGATWMSPASAVSRHSPGLCERAIAAQERAGQIPDKLLQAISLAESGRWDAARKENIAWPWTVTSGGEGQYYPTRDAAIRAVQALQRRGVRNIDVGCMQVNLHYHPKAFKSLEEAFDPAANAAYAASFLVKLRHDHRSWVTAVKHYHSATPERHGPYREKVYRIWRDERRQAQEELYAARRQKREAGETVGDRILKMADRVLNDDKFDARAQLWLENVASAMIRNSGR